LRQRVRDFDKRSWIGRHSDPVSGGGTDLGDGHRDPVTNPSIAVLVVALSHLRLSSASSNEIRRNRTTDTRIFSPEAGVAIAADFIQKVGFGRGDCSAVVTQQGFAFTATSPAGIAEDNAEDLMVQFWGRLLTERSRS
jgi:hypothetical protein